MATDDFNRADGPLGANWVVPAGSAEISGNAMAFSTGNNVVRWVGTTHADDQEAEFQIGNPGDTHCGGGVRISATGAGYVCTNGTSDSSIEVYRANGSGGYAGLTNATGLSLVSGDWIGLRIVGTTLHVIVNGVSVLSQTDSTYSSGQPGGYGFFNSTTAWRSAGDSGGGGTQTLTPPLLTRTKTIYAPSVAVGGATLTPPLLTRTKVLYAPSVSQSGAPQILAPGLLTRTKTIYSPVVVPGEVDLTPPLLTRTKVLYAPSVLTESVLTPPLLTRNKVLYAPAITVSGVTLTPPLLTRNKIIYFPTLTGGDVPVVTGGLFWPIVRRRRR